MRQLDLISSSSFPGTSLGRDRLDYSWSQCIDNVKVIYKYCEFD